ncbi:hypothetical protein Tco_0724878 [Tanacetum coccineum]|uniref:Reverse transcriptase domain-containing protein n=1 Tax=Tanacetum coccineum TaxID=301880 RepID=A0ABQ4YDN8_9ASTR
MIQIKLQKVEEEKRIGGRAQAAKINREKIPVATMADETIPCSHDYSDPKESEFRMHSPPDAEIVNSEVVEIVIPEVGGIDDDILLTIKDDILQEISSGSTTTRSDLSLSDYEAFYLDDDYIKEKNSGSTTTHADFSQYDSFIFDLSIDSFPPADRSDFYHEEFADELAHIISPPDPECFYFKIEPDPGDFIDPEIRENISSTTNVNLPFEDAQFSLSWHLIARIFKASRARGFVLRSQELHILSFNLRIQYPNLID